MEQHAVQGPDGLKKDQSQLPAQTNGSPHYLPMHNGIHHADFAMDSDKQSTDSAMDDAKPSHVALANGSVPDKDGLLATQSPQQSFPPKLDEWSHTYVSFQTLLTRIAQQCYNDILELVDALADMPVQQSVPAVNGASSHVASYTALDSSLVSQEKKLRLMTFAQSHKDRFIKALVLLDWARIMPEMNKLIELRMWLQQQDDAAPAVADAIVQMKHNMIPAKMPNPNIQGALELLSTAKAPWMPDVCLPPLHV